MKIFKDILVLDFFDMKMNFAVQRCYFIVNIHVTVKLLRNFAVHVPRFIADFFFNKFDVGMCETNTQY